MIDVEARIRASDGGPSLDVRLGIDASTVHIFERDVELEVWPIEQITLESRQASSFQFDVNGSRWIIEPRDATRFVFDALPVLTRPTSGGWRKSLRRLVDRRRSPSAFGGRRLAWSALTGLIWLAIFGLGIMVGRLRLDGKNASTWMLLVLIFAGGLTWALALGGGPEPSIRRAQESDGDPSLPTPLQRRSGAPEPTAQTRESGVVQPKRWTVRGDPSVLARLLDERSSQGPARPALRNSIQSSEAQRELESLPDERIDSRPDDTRDTDLIGSQKTEESAEPDVVESVSGRPTADESSDVSQPASQDEAHDTAAPRPVPALVEPPGSDSDADHDRPAEDQPEGTARLDAQDEDFRAISVEVDDVDLATETAEASTSSPVDVVVPLLHGIDEEDEEPGGGGGGGGGGAAGDTAPRPPDDLKVLHGVGPVLESWLNDLGIWRFDDLLAVDEVAEENLRSEFGRFSARIFRDGWRNAVLEAKVQLEQLRDTPDTSSSDADVAQGY